MDERKRPQDQAKEEEEAPKQKRPRLQSRKKRPGFDEEIFSETMYYISNGLRYVKPYYFTFTTHAKGRWVGSTVYEVFCREFQSETPKFYEKAIQAGKVAVNGKVATMETVINHNDLVCHKVHRHEPPVTAQPLKIIHCDDKLAVLDKPPSIPVHPCGRYRHNSVVFLLGKEHNLRNLHTLHRLDRLTSGLLMFARSLATAQQLEVQIRERQVTKEYVCRVQGEFPSEPVECNEPIQVVSHKLGVCHVEPSGKPCSTTFTLLSYNGRSSVVKCGPKTGRMHQIRVHLQWLGFPIMNDPLYNHPAWGPGRGRQGKGTPHMDQVLTEIVKSNYSAESGMTATIPRQQQHRIVCSAISKEEEGRGQAVTKRTTIHSGTTCVSERSRTDEHSSSGLRDFSATSTSCEPVCSDQHSIVAGNITTSIAPQEDSDTLERTTDLPRTCISERADGGNQTNQSERKPLGMSVGGPEIVETADVVSIRELQPQVHVDAMAAAEVVTGQPRLNTTSEDRKEDGEGEGREQVGVVQGPLMVTASNGSDGGLGVRDRSELLRQQCQEGRGSEKEDTEVDPDCTECGLVRPDPTSQELVMYLHALSYKGPDWEFRTDMPAWALPDWLEPQPS